MPAQETGVADIKSEGQSTAAEAIPLYQLAIVGFERDQKDVHRETNRQRERRSGSRYL